MEHGSLPAGVIEKTAARCGPAGHSIPDPPDQKISFRSYVDVLKADGLRLKKDACLRKRSFASKRRMGGGA